jgi:hypothetical protein
MTKFKSLTPEAMTLWTDALESGEYTQAGGWLHRLGDEAVAEGWCCLGVLCDIASNAGVPVLREPNGVAEGFDNYHGGLPPSVKRWAFGTTDETDDGIWSATEHLILMNDTDKASFTEISAWIKENLA